MIRYSTTPIEGKGQSNQQNMSGALKQLLEFSQTDQVFAQGYFTEAMQKKVAMIKDYDSIWDVKEKNQSYRSMYDQLIEELLARSNKTKIATRAPVVCYAAMLGYNLLIEDFLKYEGVDVNKQDNEGNTPLILALKNGRQATANTLLKHNPDLDLMNNYGQTARTIAQGQTQGSPGLLAKNTNPRKSSITVNN